MENFEEILKEIGQEEKESYKPRKPQKELRTRYDYQAAMANTIKMPIGYVLSKTKGWPMQWFFEIQSYCKTKRDHVEKVKYIHWFLRESNKKQPYD